MLVAVSEMTVLCGFRPEDDLMEDLERLGGADAAGLRRSLASGGTAAYVTDVLTSAHPDAIERLAAGAAGDSPSATVASEALVYYEGDAGALVALAMNALTLKPGEALFTPSGTVHCYIRGDGVEIMANSDNVVRAGLTHKQVNADLLRELAVLAPAAPVVPHAEVNGATVTFTPGADEFQLAVLRGGSVTADAGPRIVLSIAGRARLSVADDSTDLEHGDAVFVAAHEGPVTIDAEGVVVIASMPVARD
jgi:mannose-6-phosphate isomerase